MAYVHPHRAGGDRRWTLARAGALLAIALAWLCAVWPARALALPVAPRAQDAEGIKVGQRSTFHGGFALATGVDTNVFYEDRAEDPNAAAFIIPSTWLGIGNREIRDGLLMTPPERSGRVLDYSVSALAGFRQYLARRARVRQQSRFSIGGQIRLAFLPGRRFSVNFDEDIKRLAAPANLDAGADFNFNRIDHRGRLAFIGRPGGGRLSLTVGYNSQVLWFEGDRLSQRRNNRTVNGLFHETKWRFFPKSALVFEYTFDHTYYLSCCAEIGSGRNEDNYAHRIRAGFRGQLREKFTLDAMAGWGFGYYRDDRTVGPQNFNSFIGDVAFNYYPTLRSRLYIAGFRRFQDSLLGNYMVDNGGQIGGAHMFRWRMIATLGAGVVGRRYHGLPMAGVEDTNVLAYGGSGNEALQRRDVLATVDATLEQPFGRIWSLALSYNLTVDVSNFQTAFATETGEPDIDHAGFIKNWIMLFAAVRI